MQANKLRQWKFMLYFVWLFSFLTNEKNNAVLKPRTGRFWELVGFVAKDFKMSSRGRPSVLYHWLTDGRWNFVLKNAMVCLLSPG